MSAVEFKQLEFGRTEMWKELSPLLQRFEQRAREITEYRVRTKKNRAAPGARADRSVATMRHATSQACR